MNTNEAMHKMVDGEWVGLPGCEGRYRLYDNEIQWRIHELPWGKARLPPPDRDGWRVVPKCSRCGGEGEMQQKYTDGSYARETCACPHCKGTGVEPAPPYPVLEGRIEVMGTGTPKADTSERRTIRFETIGGREMFLELSRVEYERLPKGWAVKATRCCLCDDADSCCHKCRIIKAAKGSGFAISETQRACMVLIPGLEELRQTRDTNVFNRRLNRLSARLREAWHAAAPKAALKDAASEFSGFQVWELEVRTGCLQLADGRYFRNWATLLSSAPGDDRFAGCVYEERGRRISSPNFALWRDERGNLWREYETAKSESWQPQSVRPIGVLMRVEDEKTKEG